jgi:multicomponent Na+:H+ antiporter subunit E
VRSISYSAIVVFILAGFWWVLSGGDLQSWLVGGPAIILAWLAINRLHLSDGLKLSWWAIIQFVPYLIRESLRGGLNVGLQILSPRLLLNPEFVVFTTCLRSPQSRFFFLVCINMLPGTLVARLDEHLLTVHVLDDGADLASELSLLEAKVARIFGEYQTEHAT